MYLTPEARAPANQQRRRRSCFFFVIATAEGKEMAHTTIDLRSEELRRGRTLHVIDVENLVGTPHMTALAELHTGDIARRFARVVIASGDHIFSAAAWALRGAGVVIAVAVGRGTLSSDLHRAASAIYDLHLDVAPAA